MREDLVPRLGSDVRLVVAGRRPLGAVWRGGDRWPVAIRSLPLEGLGPEDSRAFLERGGVGDPGLAEQILAACGGWPLALSLAVDLVEQFGIRRFSRAPEWHLAVRSLVEQLLEEAAPDLRALLEAGAVVREFDEALLAALVGEDDVSDAFARLCRLSVVRPTEHGLALHDSVRRLVAEDLRWRRAHGLERRPRARAVGARPLAGGGPDEIRALVERSLALARERAGATQETALRAVELAYLERATSHERAADELYVSRATFYRLLHRGVALIADALPDAARAG